MQHESALLLRCAGWTICGVGFDQCRCAWFGANKISLREAMQESSSKDDLRLIIPAAVQS